MDTRLALAPEATQLGTWTWDMAKGDDRGGRCLGLAIGDVAGHGLPTVADMADARFSIRALALTEGSPERVLDRLDEVVRLFDDSTLVTALYGILDPGDRTWTSASAGHPPAVLRGRDRATTVIDAVRGSGRRRPTGPKRSATTSWARFSKAAPRGTTSHSWSSSFADRDAGVPIRRHLAILLGEGSLRRSIEAMRAQWDPVMAAVAPAHVTVVYPEEFSDPELLLMRIRDETRGLRSFPLDIRHIVRSDDGSGVFVRVTDRTGALTAFRERVVARSLASADYVSHVTIVHPRTSDLGPAAFAAIETAPISGSVSVSELCFTETSRDGMSVLQRFPLAPPRQQQVAALLRRDSRVLLAHRNPRRVYFPDTWDMPGGHVEPGEHAAGALARELHEELGITRAEMTELPTKAFSDDALGIDLSVWFIDRWEGEPANTAPEEHDALEWCDVEAWTARPLAHPAYPDLFLEAVGTG